MRLDLANLREAEDLEAAAVGKNGMWPVDEAMQPAGGVDDVEAGTDVEMIRVAEDDLCPHFAQFARVEGLDTALRADRHEDRSVNHAARGRETSEARARVRVGLQQFKHGALL